MAISTNLSGTTQLDESIVLAFDQSFIIATAQANVVDQFVQYKQEIGARSIALTRYDQMALATTPLSETGEVANTQMADSAIILTPKEFGATIATTKLANLQTGGKADLAAAQLVGQNMGRTTDRLGLMALEASVNKIVVGGGAAAGAGNIMTGEVLGKVYNKLARENVAFFEGNLYVAFMHDDVIADLRASAAPGSWTDVVKYTDATTALQGEVGTYKGFRIVRDNHCAVDTSGAVHQYNSSFIGQNGLGKAESANPTIVISGPFDALGRVVNIGWYGVFEYKVIEKNAAWTVVSASGSQD